MTWPDGLQVAVNVVLIVILIDSIRTSKRAMGLEKRLANIEDFLKGAVRRR